METPKGFWSHLCYFSLLPSHFPFLFLFEVIKGTIFSPCVFIHIAFSDAGVVTRLWPLHLVWSAFCTIRTKKFSSYGKCLILLLSVPVAPWTVLEVAGRAFIRMVYGFVWPVMETSQGNYVTQIRGCIAAATLGLAVGIPFVSLIVMYKTPILLLKGWHRPMQDLTGREGPFLEKKFVFPFAALLIVLWPFIDLLAASAGIASSFGFGCYSAAFAYHEIPTMKGLLYVIASMSIFDEHTDDLLYLREGSPFPSLYFYGQPDLSIIHKIPLLQAPSEGTA